jgi:hypothetical protein
MSHFHEPDSDDDSLVDDDEHPLTRTLTHSLTPIASTPTALPATALLATHLIDEQELRDLSAQLSFQETAAREELTHSLTQWENTTQLSLKKSVETLENKIERLKKKLKECSGGSGGSGGSGSDECVSEAVEEELEEVVKEHKKLSCRLYFPHSVHRMSSGGIYCALDDFWLECITGNFNLELLPAMGSDVGQVVFVLSGQASSSSSGGVSECGSGSGSSASEGVAAKFHMTNFKLKGDHLLVPSLSFDDMDVEVVFTVTVVLSFSKVTKKWHIDEDDFKVDVLEFDGPFGLTTGVLGAILGIITPLVRRQVLRELPVELGDLITSLPCPLQVNGTFQAQGTPSWDEVTSPLITSTSICALMGQTPAALLNFHAIQRSMQRPKDELLVTLNDVIAYQRKYKSTSCWPMMMEMWQDAAMAYYARTCKFEPSDTADDPSQQSFVSCVSVEKLFLGVVAAAKMPVGIEIDVTRVEGQFGIKNALEQSNLFAKRMVDEMSKSVENNKESLTVAEQELLKNMKKMILKNNDAFEFLLQRVDFMQGKSSVHVESGPAAELTGTFDNLTGQFPVALWAGLPADKIIGGNIIVPTLTKLQTTKDGILKFLFYQLGSLEMLEKCNLHKWFQDDLPDEAALTAIELAELNIHRPMFSFILDQPVEMKPGAALFTVEVGPQSEDWTPKGSVADEKAPKYLADIKPLGDKCPVLVQTSQQVKMLGKVPLVTTSVHLADMVAFLNKHFDDIEVLLDVISLTSGAKRETCMQYINFAKITISILTKYVLKPGLIMDVNMSTRVIANAQDIIVCLENRVPGMSALQLEAKIDFREIITDLTTLKSAMFNAINHKSLIF